MLYCLTEGYSHTEPPTFPKDTGFRTILSVMTRFRDIRLLLSFSFNPRPAGPLDFPPDEGVDSPL